MEPPPEVLIVPAVNEIPWQVPDVPAELAVIAIAVFVPVLPKLAVERNPMPAIPFPVIAVVAVTLPEVVNAAATLIPLLVPDA